MEKMLYVGAAKADITARVDAEKIRDTTYVRTLVARAGGLTLAILALDAVGIGWICDIPNDFLQNLRALLKERFDIAMEHVIVSATHTHPAVTEQHLPPEELLEVCAQSVQKALDDLVAVRVASGKGAEKRFTLNRTISLKDGSNWTIRHSNPCPPDEAMDKMGVLDPTIGIVKFERLDNGRTHAVLFNFACHPLWTDAPNRISGNYPGFACRTIEDCLPGATAVFLQGAAGDVIDRGFKNFEQDRGAYTRIMGDMLGLSTLKAMNKLSVDRNAQKLDFAVKVIRVPRKHDFAERIAELDAEAGSLLRQLRGCPLNLRSFIDLYLKYQLHGEHPLDYPYIYMAEQQYGGGNLREMDQVNRAVLQRYMENIEIMEKLARIEDRRETFKFHCNLNGDLADVGVEVNAIRFGDAVFVTSPTEMLTRVGLNIKNESPFENTFIAAYCNGYLHYGAPGEYYPLNGYEVTECMLDPAWQKLHEAAAGEVLQQLYNRQ
ncbi:MAG: hypothetical protein E7047_09615 [Lentisphaerae bacterium]|nr:hypothetical protein [Lentisphaerota bacterium]